METICAAAAGEGDRGARASTPRLLSGDMSVSMQHAQGTDNSSLVTLDFGPEEEIRAEKPASKGRLRRTLKKKPGRNEKKRGRQYSPMKRDEAAEAQSSIGDLVLAAELMEKASECQDVGEINQSILHDHGEYCVPNDPELLKQMVRELKKTTHQQSQLLLSFQEKLDRKEKHCQELQEKWDNERWMLLADMGQQISQLESDIRNLHCEKEILEKKNNELQEQLARSSRTVLYLSQQVKSKETDRDETSFCLKSIKNDSKWVRFYTGFDGYEQLSNFLAFLTADPELCTGKIRRRTEVGPQNALGLEDQLFLVLTRLRLGLLLQDLAFRFRVSESTVSRYWLNWTELLHARLTQVPVLYSTRYLDVFEPKRLEQYEGLTCTVMDCTDLFFEVQAKDRSKPASNHPCRNHYLRRAYAIASSNGFMTFSSSLPFGIATKIMDGQPQEETRGGITPPLQFPPFMQNDPVQLTQEQHGMSRQNVNASMDVDHIGTTALKVDLTLVMYEHSWVRHYLIGAAEARCSQQVFIDPRHDRIIRLVNHHNNQILAAKLGEP